MAQDLICDICGEPGNEGDSTYECISCNTDGLDSCCMGGGSGTECVNCADSRNDEVSFVESELEERECESCGSILEDDDIDLCEACAEEGCEDL